MERRSLVGRRYHDYLRNDIFIELTTEELLWQMVYSDPRYRVLIDRRSDVRRKTDRPSADPLTLLNPACSFLALEMSMDDIE